MSKIPKLLIKWGVSALVIAGISVLIFWLKYSFELDNRFISNSLFVPSMILFIVSLGINIGAGLVFTPFVYTVKLLFQRKKTKEEFATYHDYVERQKERHVTAWYLTIESFVFILVALIFALV
jgi:acetyltransferase-like isoleucine patch superfamily enzyme